MSNGVKLNLVTKIDSINIVFIVVLTLIIAGLCLKFLPSFPVISDSAEYDGVALSLIQGKGLALYDSPTGEPPGYPVFLAAIYYLFGHNWQIVKLIQFLLLAGMGIIVYLMAQRFLNFSRLLALFCSLFLILWPYFIFYPLLIVTEIPFTFFLLLATYFLLTLIKQLSIKNSLIAGMLLGIAALIRPSALLLPFWLVFFLLIFLKSFRQKTYFLKLVIILMVFAAILSPWLIRNYLLLNNPLPVYENVPEKSFVQLPGDTDLSVVILNKLKNIYLFWNPGAGGTNAQTLQENFPIMNALFYAYRILFFIVLALAFWSLKFIRQKKSILLLWAIIFYFWALHTVLWPYPRYTLPIIPLVIVLAWFSLRNIGYKILNKEEKV